MPWLPIDTAPRDGTEIVCYWAGDPKSCRMLIWKTNSRIVSARERGLDTEDLQDSYFGDPTEDDDYDLARAGKGPTHWHPLDPVPHNDVADNTLAIAQAAKIAADI